MRRRPLIMTSLVLTAVLAATPAALAQNKVTGEFDLLWNGCWEGPTEQVPDWIGTIDIDGNGYDTHFFSVGNGAPPDHRIPEGTGKFNEVWAVYDGLQIAFDEECALQTYEGDLLLWGLDHGTADVEAATYQMTGEVMEAFGPFDGLAGQDVYMSSTFFTNDDGVDQAPGILEIG